MRTDEMNRSKAFLDRNCTDLLHRATWMPASLAEHPFLSVTLKDFNRMTGFTSLIVGGYSSTRQICKCEIEHQLWMRWLKGKELRLQWSIEMVSDNQALAKNTENLNWTNQNGMIWRNAGNNMVLNMWICRANGAEMGIIRCISSHNLGSRFLGVTFCLLFFLFFGQYIV